MFKILYLLLPFSVLYAVALCVRDGLYKMGILKVHTLKKPVISVGNLTVGGTGKTPMTAYITGHVQQQGYKPAILTRGYGSIKKEKPLVLNDKNHHQFSPSQTGDEPMMLATQLPDVNIYVFPDRLISAEPAQNEADFLILDDGFQRRNIHKNLNILLIDATSCFGNGFLLPAGTLRGFKHDVNQAHCIVLTKTNLADPKNVTDLKADMPQGIPIFTQTHDIKSVYRYQSGEEYPMKRLIGKKLLAFCGLAAPAVFIKSLENMGLAPHQIMSFGDHHKYPESTLLKLSHAFAACSADFMITTQKDAVKLMPANLIPTDKLLIAGLSCTCPDGFDTYLKQQIEILAKQYKIKPSVR